MVHLVHAVEVYIQGCLAAYLLNDNFRATFREFDEILREKCKPESKLTIARWRVVASPTS
jgi:hypothetical protein